MPDDPTEKPQTSGAVPPADAPPATPEATSAEADEDAPGAGEAEAAEPEDEMSPEAIAKRVAALGEEDEADRIAREEEQKLAERRAKTKAGRKKAGLEAAASKRLAKIGAKAPPPKRAIATAADMDPLIERTTKLSKWAKENQGTVGAIVGIAILALAGFGGYAWWQDKRETDASALLTEAVEAERGRVGEPPKDEEEAERVHDPRPLFPTADARRDAALEKYREVLAKFKGTGAAYLARLEEASLLLDKGDLDGALAAYEDAKGSPLAQADNEVRGRALEGIGFVHERKAQVDAANKDKHLDDAIQSFRALENTDVVGFKELGMYHQARCYEAKGDKAKAVELLKSVHERVSKPGENHPFPYLEVVSEDRLRALDPTALPPRPTGPMGPMGRAPGGNPQLSEEQIRQLIEQMKKSAPQQPGAPSPAPPPAPSPPPENK